MLTIPAEDIEARVEQEVKRIAPQVRMPGFRPGKVPPNLIRKMHGEALSGDALNTRGPGRRPAAAGRTEHPPGAAAAGRARPRLRARQGRRGQGQRRGASRRSARRRSTDLKLERLTVEPDEAAVDAQLKQLAEQSKRWEDAQKKHAAENGDLVVMDFEGKVGGKPFEGGTGEGMQVELGSGS